MRALNSVSVTACVIITLYVGSASAEEPPARAVSAAPLGTSKTCDRKVKAGLSASTELNDIAQEVWKIEDETVYAGHHTNLYLGAAFGVGFWRNRGNNWNATAYAIPTAGLRFKGAGVPLHAIERANEKLRRLREYSLAGVEADLNDTLKGATAHLNELLNAQVKLITGASPSASPTPSSPGSSPAPDNPSSERSQYIEVLRADYDKQIKEAERMLTETRTSLDELDRWKCAIDFLSQDLESAGGGILGAETMLGYAFDVGNTPSSGNSMSGLVGGVGMNLSAWELTIGTGVFAQKDGVVGAYVNVEAPLFE